MIALTVYSQARVQLIGRTQILARAAETKRFNLSKTEYAKRGRILSADGKPLAQDDDRYELQVNFSKVPHSDGFFADLSAATGIPASEFRALAIGGGGREWRKPLGPEQSRAVRQVKTNWRADGVDVQRGGRRSYALGGAAAGIVGLSTENGSISGLELSQDKALSGSDGVTIGLVDNTGAFLPMRLDKSSVSKLDGVDVQLTVDFDLQQAAARAIKKAVVDNKADQGAAIVMDPATGDILAMANWPTFDPNTEGGRAPGMAAARDFNPSTMARFEPGSTFKILTLAKALDAGVVKETDTFYCSGQTIVRGWPLRCDAHHGQRAHGQLDITKAIAKSCNVTASVWSRRVGHKDFVHFIEDLGLLEKPGLGLPGEQKGDFNYSDYAKDLQLAIVGFGQAINTTPISLATAFASLANDGKCMYPRLISRIGNRQFPPEEALQVVSPKTAGIVMKTMEAVVMTDAGTGKSLRIPGYRLAGKTGTAQKIGKNTTGYVSNFVGYVPAEAPKALILVMVDNPKAGKYYGASVAGPVFVDLAKAVIRRYEIPREAKLPSTGPKNIVSRSVHPVLRTG